jgi:pseudouridine kinase
MNFRAGAVMTNKEKEMFEIIKKNPRISQSDLSKALGITRSSVSVHITNLIKKGYIEGRGYILRESDYVVVIGAANVDINGLSENPIIMGDSNPGTIEICLGGVSRNIAENLVRLNTEVKLITAIGADTFGEKIASECRQAGIDISHSMFIEGSGSSIYAAIVNNTGELTLALSDMHVLEKMTIDHLRRKTQLIKNGKILVIDAGLSEEVINYLVSAFKDFHIFLDPVSVGKAKKVKNIIGNFDTLKLSRLEAEYLSDIKIEGEKSLEKIGSYFIKKGVNRVFISTGREGIYFYSKTRSFLTPVQFVEAVNASGAGDAFMAGIVYGTLHHLGEEETIEFASAMAALTVQSAKTVSELMNRDNVAKIINTRRRTKI